MVASTSLNVVPEDPTAYKTQEYWEERYKKEDSNTTFDWFKTYADLKPLLNEAIPSKEAKILMLGCGNSTLGEDMYNDGYKNITNIDYSKTVIDNMKERCADKPEMNWLEMDIRDLKFANESFDVVIDKGTMDALMCDRGDVWDPSEELIKDVKGEVDEVERVLKVGGTFLFFSSGKLPYAVAQLDRISKLCTDVNRVQSTLKKQALLAQSPDCHSTLKRIYNPHLRHHVSAKTILKYMQTHTITANSSYDDLNKLLDDLSSRSLTGHAACEATGSFYLTYCKTEEHQNIFWRILDKNLKMGVSIKTICRLLPMESMSVALAASSASFNLSDPWYVSQKLDGIRCITVIRQSNAKEQHDIQFYSRTGRSFQSLQKVKTNIQKRLHELSIKDDFVLDGEVCAYSSDMKHEDFLKAMGQVRRYEEMENPIYQVFDRIRLDQFMQGKGDQLFSQRQKELESFLGTESLPHIKKVAQTRLTSLEQLDQLKKHSIEKGWEGLMLRKDVAYEGKRTRDLIKLKEWVDAEYIVKSIETGLMRMPDTGENKLVLTNVNIEHKGYPVGVGSGFSMQSRIDYAQNPERIIGKPITVRYFSESKKENGAISLRFPTVKAVFEDGERDV
ncbi:hypothetical protein [Parasitella parasitica]|uniref:ATP-dependent DNA ligase family profile domain-containing protein n=1 Tax=Parasitella parasitica TaxID=35722 RepID=A0A0B7NLZ9_9FUNG|nr:hypothetical protein [Parasitella parasitica]